MVFLTSNPRKYINVCTIQGPRWCDCRARCLVRFRHVLDSQGHSVLLGVCATICLFTQNVALVPGADSLFARPMALGTAC
ncbi:hypothetical protein BV22DRAFT_452885 [Leucogyrophana mollusca]|uniref:Uncharacterized protein n=1 Tax=Leucogyrophana mollusca TaxID=85980 RepID=A0ACB8BIB2_9AGAM|nr:hypothetical protein BV22DRAFT_452885 [Leucogyrophana mollusca]